MGDGWTVAKIEDEYEYNFINQAHISDHILRNFFISGRTDDETSLARLDQKFGFSDSGKLLGYIYSLTPAQKTVQCNGKSG